MYEQIKSNTPQKNQRFPGIGIGLVVGTFGIEDAPGIMFFPVFSIFAPVLIPCVGSVGTAPAPGIEDIPGMEDGPGIEEAPGIEETPGIDESPGTDCCIKTNI